ncbi:MAG: hypothetical protein WDO68_02535 [Gammaproteobacteria bacterium]
MAENSKRWWETVGGLMTGIAALISAITALIVALYTLRQPESRSASLAPAPIGTSSTARKTAEETIRPSGEPRTSVAAQPAHPVALPEKPEYVLGPEGQTARYELQAAVISTSTSEADILRIHVRFANLSDRANSRMYFQSSSFQLVIDERRLQPKENFNYTVLAKKVRQEDVLFLISKDVKRATLKIGNSVDGVDVPLDLSRGI